LQLQAVPTDLDLQPVIHPILFDLVQRKFE
jgi:hypothetical protein